jgi:hypothetical protein
LEKVQNTLGSETALRDLKELDVVNQLEKLAKIPGGALQKVPTDKLPEGITPDSFPYKYAVVIGNDKNMKRAQ